LFSSPQAEGGDAFSEFHLYVCLAFLVRWSDKLREMDFQVRRREDAVSGWSVARR
jgi:hypothetical protein